MIKYLVVLVLFVPSVFGSFELVILHTNDVHARFEQTNRFSGVCSADDAAENDCYGGVARRYTQIERLRAARPNSTILLDAGDQFQGTLWFSQYTGRATSYFMNLLGYDVMALGNHEFDNGAEGLEPFLRNVTFPVVSCNINASADTHINGLFAPSTVLDVGGERVAVIGYTSSDTSFLVEQSGIRNVKFEDEITSIQREVDRLTSDGVNKIILLGHGGFEFDIRIAKAVTGVDIIVGGHSNTFLYTGPERHWPSIETARSAYPTPIQENDGGPVYIVQAYAYGKYLGHLTVVFDDNGDVMSATGNPILLNASIEQDSRIAELVDEWAMPLQTLRETVVGESYVLLHEPELCRLAECNLGNLVCDAVLESHLSGSRRLGDPWTDISLVMLNGGGFRSSVLPGKITMEHVLDVLPFRNTEVMVRIPGSVVREALEHSVSDYSVGDPQGRYLQFSGFQVVYDVEQPLGSRVMSVRVRCQNCSHPYYEELAENQLYNVLINNYMYNGGDSYDMFKASSIETREYGTLLSDSLVSYVQRHSPIFTGTEGRIYNSSMAIAPAMSTRETVSTDETPVVNCRTESTPVDSATGLYHQVTTILTSLCFSLSMYMYLTRLYH